MRLLIMVIQPVSADVGDKRQAGALQGNGHRMGETFCSPYENHLRPELSQRLAHQCVLCPFAAIPADYVLESPGFELVFFIIRAIGEDAPEIRLANSAAVAPHVAGKHQDVMSTGTQLLDGLAA